MEDPDLNQEIGFIPGLESSDGREYLEKIKENWESDNLLFADKACWQLKFPRVVPLSNLSDFTVLPEDKYFNQLHSEWEVIRRIDGLISTPDDADVSFWPGTLRGDYIRFMQSQIAHTSSWNVAELEYDRIAATKNEPEQLHSELVVIRRVDGLISTSDDSDVSFWPGTLRGDYKRFMQSPIAHASSWNVAELEYDRIAATKNEPEIAEKYPVSHEVGRFDRLVSHYSLSQQFREWFAGLDEEAVCSLRTAHAVLRCDTAGAAWKVAKAESMEQSRSLYSFQCEASEATALSPPPQCPPRRLFRHFRGRGCMPVSEYMNAVCKRMRFRVDHALVSSLARASAEGVYASKLRGVVDGREWAVRALFEWEHRVSRERARSTVLQHKETVSCTGRVWAESESSDVQSVPFDFTKMVRRRASRAFLEASMRSGEELMCCVGSPRALNDRSPSAEEEVRAPFQRCDRSALRRCPMFYKERVTRKCKRVILTRRDQRHFSDFLQAHDRNNDAFLQALAEVNFVRSKPPELTVIRADVALRDAVRLRTKVEELLFICNIHARRSRTLMDLSESRRGKMPFSGDAFVADCRASHLPSAILLRKYRLRERKNDHEFDRLVSHYSLSQQFREWFAGLDEEAVCSLRTAHAVLRCDTAGAAWKVAKAESMEQSRSLYSFQCEASEATALSPPPQCPPCRFRVDHALVSALARASAEGVYASKLRGVVDGREWAVRALFEWEHRVSRELARSTAISRRSELLGDEADAERHRYDHPFLSVDDRPLITCRRGYKGADTDSTVPSSPQPLREARRWWTSDVGSSLLLDPLRRAFTAACDPAFVLDRVWLCDGDSVELEVEPSAGRATLHCKLRGVCSEHKLPLNLSSLVATDQELRLIPIVSFRLLPDSEIRLIEGDQHTLIRLKQLLLARADLDAVNALIDSFSDVNCVCFGGLTALHLASSSLNLHAVEFLLTRGSCITHRDSSGNTPLLLVVLATLVGEKLLSVDHPVERVAVNETLASLMSQSTRSDTASDQFIYSLLDVLIERNSDVNATNVAGDTALHLVAGRHTALLNYLIKKGANVNSTGAGGLTVLHRATAVTGVAKEGEASIRTLLSSGADVDARSVRSGETALHVAAVTGSASQVEMLIRAHSDVNARDKMLRTPLHLAAETVGADESVVNAIIRVSNDVKTSWRAAPALDLNALDSAGMTPLLCALKCGSEAVARRLLDSGSDIGLVARDGRGVVHAAVLGGKPGLLKHVLRHAGLSRGLLVNSLDVFGKSPLHYAVCTACEEDVKVLLEAGASVGNECTALHSAVEMSLEGIVALLTKNVSDLSLVPACEDILFNAVAKCNARLVGQLLPKFRSMPNVLDKALYLAVEAVKIDVVELLIKFGASLTKPVGAGNQTCLHLISARGKGLTAVVPKTTGLDNVNAVTSGGKSALYLAIEHGNADVARALIEAGANVHVCGPACRPLLHLAIEKQNSELALLLMGRGVDVHKEGPCDVGEDWLVLPEDAWLCPAVYLAVRGGMVDVVRALKEVNEKNRSVASLQSIKNPLGQTLLHVAVECGQMETLRVLLETTDVPSLTTWKNAVDDSGFRPVHYAVRLGSDIAFSLLVEYDVDAALSQKEAERYQALIDEQEALSQQLQPAKRLVEQAHSALDSINYNEFLMLPKLAKPPRLVRLVGEAVCIMLSVQPDEVIPDPESPSTRIVDYWKPCTKLLANVGDLLKQLKDYDKDNISDEIMANIEDNFIVNEEFDPLRVANASKAAEGLCRWVLSVISYGKMAKLVAPKKAALADEVAKLKLKRESIASPKDYPGALDRQLVRGTINQDDLESKVRLCNQEMVRATGRAPSILAYAVENKREAMLAVFFELSRELVSHQGRIEERIGSEEFISTIRERTKEGLTMLHLAVAGGDVAIVSLIVSLVVKHKVQYVLYDPTDSGETALDLAIKANHTSLVPILLDALATPPPAFRLVESGSDSKVEVVELRQICFRRLHLTGCDATCKCRATLQVGEIVYSIATEAGSWDGACHFTVSVIDTIDVLLVDDGWDSSGDGSSPQHPTWSQRASFKVCCLPLDSAGKRSFRANVRKVDEKRVGSKEDSADIVFEYEVAIMDEQTPLHLAARLGRSDMIPLLSRAFDVNAKTRDSGDTALQLACKAKHDGCVEALLVTAVSPSAANAVKVYDGVFKDKFGDHGWAFSSPNNVDVFVQRINRSSVDDTSNRLDDWLRVKKKKGGKGYKKFTGWFKFDESEGKYVKHRSTDKSSIKANEGVFTDENGLLRWVVFYEFLDKFILEPSVSSAEATLAAKTNLPRGFSLFSGELDLDLAAPFVTSHHPSDDKVLRSEEGILSRIQPAPLLCRAPLDVNSVNFERLTSLLYAVGSCVENSVLTLLERSRCDKTISDPKSKETALHLACSLGFTQSTISCLADKETVNAQDKLGQTPLHIACKKGFLWIIFQLLKDGSRVDVNDLNQKKPLAYLAKGKVRSVFVDYSFALAQLEAGRNSLWFQMIQFSEEECSGISGKVLEYVRAHPHLATARDADNRLAISMATSETRKAIQSVIFIRQRFEIPPGPPLHRSMTSAVFFSIDHMVSDKPVKVVLKFMSEKDQFEREVSCREKANLDPAFVIGIILKIDDFTENDVRTVQALRDFFDLTDFRFFYVIVMPAADRSLDAIYRTERPNGSAIISTMRQLGTAIHSIHKSGLMHGDLKLLNILRIMNTIKLIDLDASAMLRDGFVGAKFSSGILPPEMFALLTVDQKEKFELYFHEEKDGKTALWEKVKPVQFGKTKYVVVKTFLTAEAFDETLQMKVGVPKDRWALPYELVRASCSVDVWSFGVLLYNMLSKDCLMNVNRDDDLSADSVVKIVSWSDEAIRREVLLNVKDEYAADLLFHVLRVNPVERMQSFNDILSHPYFNTSARTENAERVNEALSVVKRELVLVEAVSKRSGLIARRTRELDGVSDKAFSQLWKTEKILLRDGRVFNNADTDIPICLTILDKLLTKPLAVSESGIEAHTPHHEDTSQTVAAAEGWLGKVANFGSRLDALIGLGDEPNDLGVIGVDELSLREELSAACSAFVKSLVTDGRPLYLYLLDEYTMQPVVGDDGDVPSVYPLVLDKPYETVLALLPLWRISLKASASLNGVTGIARCVGYPSLRLPTSLKDLAQKAVGRLDQNNSLLEYDLLQVSTVVVNVADANAVRGAALQRLSLIYAMKDPDCNFSNLMRIWTANVSCWASVESVKSMEHNELWFGRYRPESRPEHMSSTSFLFKAVDERTLDEFGQPIRVALKLVIHKEHFLREMESRKNAFDKTFVVDILTTYPAVLDSGCIEEHSASNIENSASARISSSTPLHDRPDIVVLQAADADEVGRIKTGQLNKALAEQLFCLVMPFADRNLFVAMKQELFAAKYDLEDVKYLFIQLVKAVQHMHSKGVVHGDLKPMNIVRTGLSWFLIDLDAACSFGEPMGHKLSSAYIPPEAVYVDLEQRLAMVKSVIRASGEGAGSASYYDLLRADPAFDVWSLGCILYQLCNRALKPLFHAGQDDNLSADYDEDMIEDNLFILAEWSDDTQDRKLTKITDSLACNLVAQMLQKDPVSRPSLSRVLSHPFLSGKPVVRLAGVRPAFDAFLSYRVASDKDITEKLYEKLTGMGLKVWWDAKCLKDAKNWEEGFCSGLVNSCVFVCLLSREGIHHPHKAWNDFEKLQESSECDNVFLEHRLSLELKSMGMLDSVFPVVVGDRVTGADGVTSYVIDWRTIWPNCSDVSVRKVEEKLVHHLASQALGTPLQPNRTVASVFGEIRTLQGALVEGELDEALSKVATRVRCLVEEAQLSPRATPRLSPRPRGSVSANPRGGAGADLVAKDRELSEKQRAIDSLTAELEKFRRREKLWDSCL